MRTITAALAATAVAAALTACGAQTVVAPTAADLSYTAAQKLQASTTQCQADAWAQFPGFAHEPSRELALIGCERVTCDSLASYVNTAAHASRDPKYGHAASEWLADRWRSAGCLEVQARAEAAG